MTNFLKRRMTEQKAAGRDGKRPFLTAVGSLKPATIRGGVGQALFGIAIATPFNAFATDLLHPHHLHRAENLNTAGRFRWSIGIPLLRVRLASPPVRFTDLVGISPRLFNNSDGVRVVPLEEFVPGLGAGIAPAKLRKAVLDRASPLSPSLAKLDAKWREGGLRYSTQKDPIRDPEMVQAAMAVNFACHTGYRYDACGYRLAKKPQVPKGKECGMLDVHHLEGISAGGRETTLVDVLVLCPRCHRKEHLGPGTGCGEYCVRHGCHAALQGKPSLLVAIARPMSAIVPVTPSRSASLAVAQKDAAHSLAEETLRGYRGD